MPACAQASNDIANSSTARVSSSLLKRRRSLLFRECIFKRDAQFEGINLRSNRQSHSRAHDTRHIAHYGFCRIEP